MIKKLMQIYRDHKAMNIFRKYQGDLQLTSFVDVRGNGYECRIFQHVWCELDADPSKAVLKAYSRWQKEPHHF